MSKGLALISVSDKTGICDLCRDIQKIGYNIVATNSTYLYLKKNNIKAIQISELTGLPEILDGRVKTLHPTVFAGILYNRNKTEHKNQINKAGINSIDIVVCNLYPFAEMSKKNLSYEEMIEYIDIGGVSLIRAAAKANIPILTHFEQYKKFRNVLKKSIFQLEYIKKLSATAFYTTFSYDRTIHNYFVENKILEKDFTFNKNLRYGENPHQKASIYKEKNTINSLCDLEILQGKELSYNNYLDIDAALSAIKEFKQKCCVIVKHGNSCGLCQGKDSNLVYQNALKGDLLSSFGGICAVNFNIEEELALKMKEHFYEIIIARDFSDKARIILAKKKNLRLVIYKEFDKKTKKSYISIEGSLLVQDKDNWNEDFELNIVSKKKPDKKDIEELLFAFKVVKNIKSNAIAITKDKKLLGMGAGQPSRIDSVELAVKKAKNEIKESYLASDGFFPFADGVEKACKAGIKAIIQPGGSKGDKEVIKKADEFGIIMVFTGKRHFKH
ncbi:MAG: bifunctional phosphoribosylaminoimidazolecarboxamide formyltransferase/IMP cyclohydrolase [Candidatus Muirbacterium halophilum]|nr:bifunctional phosphoribosylaminoimidazolecarboxamide formyltransferase/IMP cyclohydrolase [Candidatus Muirbacterium halophilum]MCK9474933.1 bifunctional phosphoribosylaminoimidazolecarboxamide formyltransferase/IMP cyclohydrolase [Candidatus Muirbacterium halophilum]